MRLPHAPLVGLDVDGVLYRFGKGVRKVTSEMFGIEISEDEWFVEASVPPHVWSYLWSDEGVKRIFYEGRAFPGAVKFTRQLYDVANVRILTAIPENAQETRRRWLRNRGIPFDELVFVEAPRDPGQKVGTNGHLHASKSAVLPHCDVYIDDSVSNCVDLAENTGAHVVLVDHSWNANDPRVNAVPRGRIERLSRWEDILWVVQ